MKTYVGIDLGTTNSAICSFDGEQVKVYKSPEQHDVTPSAIFMDKRGNKYVGARAYDNAPSSPDNAATLFKRFMGTSTPVKIPAVNQTLTPEECSAEILRVLFGYLPEEMRNDPDIGTVITVPAAFNQMQKDATKTAAEIAGIGKVALMQEPVAAVMSVMRQRKGDGTFLVYDLGGGTLDVAIAESISSRVSLRAHGGIAMCGGRDFDRLLMDNVVKSWLLDKFDLPDDLAGHAKFKKLIRIALWATEKAKIELSSKEETIISCDEARISLSDLAGQEIYLDVPIQRSVLDELIAKHLDDSIVAARETMEKAGLSAHDIERIVFVGGPTHYKPLRDKVAFELGIAASTEVNPMIAVAEGAAVFAESIDWSSESRGRKSSRGSVVAGGRLDLSFQYIARTPSAKTKIAVKLGTAPLSGTEFQVDNLDTGWSSGRIALKDGATLEVALSKAGDNTFKVFVFDAKGGAITLENNKIVITRTEATIDAIPASSSIGIEALDKIGGVVGLDYLVKEGDMLPKKGQKKFSASETLRAKGRGSLNFKLWEGEIAEPGDNRFIGCLSITGQDFDSGVISAGAELICDYEVLDSGNIRLEITVPSVGGTFGSGRNFYSSQTGQINYASADTSRLIQEDADQLRSRVENAVQQVDNPKLDQALEKLDRAQSIPDGETDPETTKQAMDSVLDAKKLLAQVRKEHLKEIRQMELDICVDFFNEQIRPHARQIDASAFDRTKNAAQQAIRTNSTDFEPLLKQLKEKNFQILWQQDWFVVEQFQWMVGTGYHFPDQRQYAALIAAGKEAIQADDIGRLRQIVGELYSIRMGSSSEDEMTVAANIVRG